MARFQINTEYVIELPAGELSPEGAAQVLDHIYIQNLRNEDWLTLNPDKPITTLPALPDDWSWAWVVQKGEYAGTLPKRIRSFYFKAHGIKCPDLFIESIGNIARQHTGSQTVYRFQIVREFNWDAGDYGDYGSCYWGGNAGARLMLTENGGMAICFSTDSGTGYARAWLVAIDIDLFVIFNGYGFGRGENATLTIARVFSTFTTLSYKKIELDNSSGSTLYINSNSGYIIGTPQDIEGIESWDFEWNEIYAETCSNCGAILDEHDTHYGADDNVYCYDCYVEMFDRCEICDEIYHNEDIYYIESVEQSVCDYCRVRDFDVCEGCHEWILKDELHTHEDNLFCWQCLNDETSPPDWAE